MVVDIVQMNNVRCIFLDLFDNSLGGPFTAQTLTIKKTVPCVMQIDIRLISDLD